MNPLKNRRGSSITGMPTVMVVLAVQLLSFVTWARNLRRRTHCSRELAHTSRRSRREGVESQSQWIWGRQGTQPGPHFARERVRERSYCLTTYSSRRSRRGRGNSAFDLGVKSVLCLIMGIRSRIRSHNRCRSRKRVALRDDAANSLEYSLTSDQLRTSGTAAQQYSFGRGVGFGTLGFSTFFS